MYFAFFVNISTAWGLYRERGLTSQTQTPLLLSTGYIHTALFCPIYKHKWQESQLQRSDFRLKQNLLSPQPASLLSSYIFLSASFLYVTLMAPFFKRRDCFPPSLSLSSISFFKIDSITFQLDLKEVIIGLMVCASSVSHCITHTHYSSVSNNRAAANNRVQGKSSGDIVSCR